MFHLLQRHGFSLTKKLIDGYKFNVAICKEWMMKEMKWFHFKGLHRLRINFNFNWVFLHLLLYFIFPCKLNDNIKILIDWKGSFLGGAHFILMSLQPDQFISIIGE
jgi:hypothetical protein